MTKNNELNINMIQSLLRLYEEQENIRITVVVKNKRINNKYLYKDGNINAK